MTYRMRTKVWMWQGESGGNWHFAYVSDKASARIRSLKKTQPRRGFGAVRVLATVGKTSWETSIFPSKENAMPSPLAEDPRDALLLSRRKAVKVVYLPPIKAEVRKKECLRDGEVISLSLVLR